MSNNFNYQCCYTIDNDYLNIGYMVKNYYSVYFNSVLVYIYTYGLLTCVHDRSSSRIDVAEVSLSKSMFICVFTYDIYTKSLQIFMKYVSREYRKLLTKINQYN